VLARLDAFQRRHRWAALPLAVAYKFADDQGGYLAALITYYGFLSLFPALLLLVTITGYVLAGDPVAQQQLIDTAVARLPVIGTQIQHNLSSLEGNGVALAVGVVGLLYGVLGVGQALQLTFNRAWAVPRNRRPNPFRSRLRSAGLVGLAGAGLVLTSGLTGVATATSTLDSHVADAVRALLLCGAAILNVLLYVAAFRLLTAREVSARDLLPGALFAAIGWQLLQALGTTYVERVVARSSDVYGVFGVVLGLIAWIYLTATLAVLAAELNVVRACRLWPRSLLAPFTDDSALTPADRRAYVSYAQMTRFKSRENIDVSFAPQQREESQPSDDSRP
jgi:membrane protein